MNLEQARLPALLEKLPALRRPTISNLSQPGWVAVETVIDERVVRELIPRLKAAGADILYWGGLYPEAALLLRQMRRALRAEKDKGEIAEDRKS